MTNKQELPRALPERGCLGLFSPSEPILGTRPARLEKSLEILRGHNFRIKFAPNYMNHTSYMAGTVRERVDDIHSLAEDDEVDVLLGAWGGKSCNQLLPHLDYELLQNARKPVMGFSDVAVLLNAITAKTGLITFHGPNVAGKMFETDHSDMGLIRNEQYATGANLLGKVPEGARSVVPGKAEGTLFGGNLSTFTLGVAGTEFQPRYERGVFFWESGGETPQIIDQFLTCLRNLGVFDDVVGMVIGNFIREETTEWKQRDPFAMIKDVLDGYDFPVIYYPSFGHSPIENPIIPIGAPCVLDAESMTLLLAGPVVSGE